MKLTAVAALVVVILSFSVVTIFAQDESEALWSKADAAFQQGDFKQAGTLYARYLRIFPNSEHSENAHFFVAESYKNDLKLASQIRLRNAIAAYELALSTFPDSDKAPYAFEKLALLYIRQGFLQDAIIQLRRARENYPLAPNSERLLRLLSDCYFAMKDFQQANLHLETLLSEYPDSPEINSAKIKLALTKHGMSKHREAVPLFRQVMSDVPSIVGEIPSIYFHMGESLMFSGDTMEAEQYFKNILEDTRLLDLQPHAILRLGDTYRLMAQQADGEEADSYFRSSMSQYLQLYIRGEPKSLWYQAVFRAVQVADEAGLDFAEDYQLDSAETLLHSIYDESREAEISALTLTILAQHHRHHDLIIPALDAYKMAINEYTGLPLVNGMRTEYRKYAQDNLRQAFANRNYEQVVNIFLGYIQDMELSAEDRLMLGISFTRVRLFNQAMVYFNVLFETGVSPEVRRTVLLEILKIQMFRQQHEEAQKSIKTILGLSPLPRERELSLFYQQQIWFDEKRVIELRNLYLEHKESWDTPLLRASLLYKLGALEFLERNFADAEFYLASFYRDFPLGLENEQPVAEMVVSAALTFADLHFINERYDQATRYYDYYLFYSPEDGPLDWALLQTARSRRQIGQTELALLYLQEFIDNYPGSYLMQQANNLKTELELLR